MVATPFDLFLEFTNAAGKVVQTEVGDCSDVADAYVTWKSVGSETSFNVRQDCWLTDIKADGAGGTDTLRTQLFVDGLDKGIYFVGAGIIVTVNNRLPTPIGAFKSGSKIQLKQLA